MRIDVALKHQSHKTIKPQSLNLQMSGSFWQMFSQLLAGLPSRAYEQQLYQELYTPEYKV